MPAMQFVVIAHDGSDEDALDRRMRARAAHIELGDRLRAEGHALYGVAMLDDAGTMVGSVMVMEYPSRAALDEWLAIEPYMIGGVWHDVQVRPCRVGPSFI
jgi:uncharacterized protein